MKKAIILIALFSALNSFSQDAITKYPGDFDKVTTFDQIDALLIPSNENKVILNGKDADKVEIVNRNGELKIRMPIEKLLQGDNISATVFFKKLEAVEANEGSRIASDVTFKTNTFKVIAKEGSEIRLLLDVEKLNVKASGGSKTFLDGSAASQDVLINSGALYEATKLITSQTDITVNAGGNANINAVGLVEAKVRAGGNITIYGKPKQVNQKIIAGGTIKEAGE